VEARLFITNREVGANGTGRSTPAQGPKEASVIKVVLLLSRRADLSAAEFRSYWREKHAPLLLQMPGLQRLVFNYAQPGMDGAPPEYDGISEDWFESAEAMQTAFGSPAGQGSLRGFTELPRHGAVAVAGG
jgi:uncharacterized protein (TIGR02118 family)